MFSLPAAGASIRAAGRGYVLPAFGRCEHTPRFYLYMMPNIGFMPAPQKSRMSETVFSGFFRAVFAELIAPVTDFVFEKRIAAGAKNVQIL